MKYYSYKGEEIDLLGEYITKDGRVAIRGKDKCISIVYMMELKELPKTDQVSEEHMRELARTWMNGDYVCTLKYSYSNGCSSLRREGHLHFISISKTGRTVTGIISNHFRFSCEECLERMKELKIIE